MQVVGVFYGYMETKIGPLKAKAEERMASALLEIRALRLMI